MTSSNQVGTSLAEFEAWLGRQPEIITPKFTFGEHPIARWAGEPIIVAQQWVSANDTSRHSLWCLESTGKPLPDWGQYLCSRTFHKPYGVKIEKNEVQSWIRHYKADQA